MNENTQVIIGITISVLFVLLLWIRQPNTIHTTDPFEGCEVGNVVIDPFTNKDVIIDVTRYREMVFLRDKENNVYNKPCDEVKTWYVINNHEELN